MGYERTVRLNSLLREVLSDVIRGKVKNPKVSQLVTVTRVAITRDLRYAKVYISTIGENKEREETMEALNSAKGFIAITAAKEVRMRHFPELTFLYDDGVEKQARIDSLLHEVSKEREKRPETDD
jgi:ribosome-binding factor A